MTVFLSRRFLMFAGAAMIAVLGLAPAQSQAQDTAATLPIADLHFHPGQNGKTPAQTREAFDISGVRWFGLGAAGSPSAIPDYFRAFGDRFITFAGQMGMEQIWQKGGERELNNADNADFKQLLKGMEPGLAAGKIAGIGELFVNNRRSTALASLGRKMVIDGPVIRALFELAATYHAFVAFHMEGDKDSVEQLERLAASNPRGRIILNHCGVNLGPAEIDRLFGAHPNLFCEFSVRYPPQRRPGSFFTEIFNASGIDAGWKETILKHADHFMVGTDAEGNNDNYIASIRNLRSGLLANLPPEAARQVAHGNAMALFGLK